MREILEEHGLSQNVIDAVIDDLKDKPVESKLNLHARLELGIVKLHSQTLISIYIYTE